MKILLLGATGQVGYALAVALARTTIRFPCSCETQPYCRSPTASP